MVVLREGFYSSRPKPNVLAERNGIFQTHVMGETCYYDKVIFFTKTSFYRDKKLNERNTTE